MTRAPETPVPAGEAAAAGKLEHTPAATFGELAHALRAEVMTGVHTRLHLVALECRQATLHFTQMVMLATLAALMLCGAWATVLIGLYMTCVAYGLPWAAALAILLALNVAGALLVWLWAHSLSAAMSFPATRRMLENLAPGKAEAAQP